MPITIHYVVDAVIVLLLFHVAQSHARLRHIPGPFLAKFTDLWRLLIVRGQDSHNTYLALHKDHGDLVRIGPNCVSICKPDLVQAIYGIGKGYIKSDFYLPWQNVINGKRSPSLVFTTDEAQHAAMKRPIAPAYSLSTLVEFEPLIDSTIAVFLSTIDQRFASTGKVCDLGQYLQWFAFDVMGELTFSERLGFLEKGEDVEGICKAVGANFDRCSVLGQMPWLDLVKNKNPFYQRFFAKAVGNPVVAFGQRRLQERLQSVADEIPSQEELQAEITDPTLRAKVLHGTLPSKPDFLSRFLQLHEEQPDIVTDRQLLAYLFMNINAGSDTIGSTLRAVFYLPPEESHLLPPTETRCQQLPYLNAVIKEALRLNPALALSMERIVPADGLQIDSTTFIPAGTIVGINPWILHRDTRIFGPDAADWNPSRWLSKDADQVKNMEQHSLAFGAGKRTCLGRNIAMLELLKLVPAMVLRYRIELADPEREWKIFNSFVVRQEGLIVKFAKL